MSYSRMREKKWPKGLRAWHGYFQHLRNVSPQGLSCTAGSKLYRELSWKKKSIQQQSWLLWAQKLVREEHAEIRVRREKQSISACAWWNISVTWPANWRSRFVQKMYFKAVCNSFYLLFEHAAPLSTFCIQRHGGESRMKLQCSLL